MVFKVKSDAAARNATANGKSVTPDAPQNGYAPSVPISVYRELAAELQATKAMLESVSGQNQMLAQQNQYLRHEIEEVVRSTLTLQQVLMQPAIGVSQPVMPSQFLAQPAPVVQHASSTASAPPPKPVGQRKSAPTKTKIQSSPAVEVREVRSESASTPAAAQPAQSQPGASPNTSSPDAKPVPESPILPDLLFTEQREEQLQKTESKPREMGSTWLVLTVVVIMVSAFAAGFLVMRPFLPKLSR